MVNKLGKLDLRKKVKPYPGLGIVNERLFYYLRSGKTIFVYSEELRAKGRGALTRRSHDFLIRQLTMHRKF